MLRKNGFRWKNDEIELIWLIVKFKSDVESFGVLNGGESVENESC